MGQGCVAGTLARPEVRLGARLVARPGVRLEARLWGKVWGWDELYFCALFKLAAIVAHSPSSPSVDEGAAESLIVDSLVVEPSSGSSISSSDQISMSPGALSGAELALALGNRALASGLPSMPLWSDVKMSDEVKARTWKGRL